MWKVTIANRYCIYCPDGQYEVGHGIDGEVVHGVLCTKMPRGRLYTQVLGWRMHLPGGKYIYRHPSCPYSRGNE